MVGTWQKGSCAPVDTGFVSWGTPCWGLPDVRNILVDEAGGTVLTTWPDL
ncbi:hypothetical protein IM697_10560 [Streptomyces ferrugineus]|uniref:Uncharacterized protein n=1 Tax=Streptomyces ferrugineus TaxID=1413221 RepID=A0A7M2STD5_9ACTN|nr:hypothetical protein [Streptomyces ferrugineus]QOV38773.1 hypothetical protein IM697_10560 [Streptomyces ferrugineus]